MMVFCYKSVRYQLQKHYRKIGYAKLNACIFNMNGGRQVRAG